MTNVVQPRNDLQPYRPPVPVRRSFKLDKSDPRRLQLFCKTVGKELVAEEVDEAVEWCKVYDANPFTKEIYFFVFGTYGQPDRKLVPVLSIGKYRMIASDTGCYRPDDQPALFEYNESLIGPDNPRGIEAVTVGVYQFSYADNQWHRHSERVRWEERAPIIEGGSQGFDWEDTGDVYPPGHAKAGKKKFRKVPKGEAIKMLDPGKRNWATMPETMLAKCCEAAAIRKGWPAQTQGSYVEDELDRAKIIDLTAVEIISQLESDERRNKTGLKNPILVDWLDGKPLAAVEADKFFGLAMDWLDRHLRKGHEEYGLVAQWANQNRVSLQQFWVLKKDEALALKKRIEQAATDAVASEAEETTK